MKDFEKLGVFYLGREYDVGKQALKDDLVLYDSRDLTTHAMIIGMTGSGKTGLGIDVLEEAGIDGIPAIAIDPKGDLTNLLLTFPKLTADAFRPWINEDDAGRAGVSADQYAEQQAKAWKDGLAQWGEDEARIARFRSAVDLDIYTPGSTAGRPLSVLKSFGPPPPEIASDQELLAERTATTASGLLTLLGIDADPVSSREHILLSTIFSTAWAKNESLDLATLIARVQSPPVARVGVLDMESFFPSADRFAFAKKLNGLLAAPGFSAWMEGDPLDVGRLLHGADGKPRIAVISIAHLGDAERMFVVALLFNEILGWVRRQPGTSSLRAVVYMDEVAGYMPPIANPASKPAMLTLLRQGRAFGLGVVLATQNPGDLDYKGLTNIGTWMIGRLQTERDKGKVLDGLEGVLAASGHYDRAALDRTISALGKRVFVLHDVHDDGPTVFQTRWTLSYLRGPLTRDQIRSLVGSAAAAPPVHGAAPSSRVVLPPDIPQFFAPSSGAGSPRYVPSLLAVADVRYEDAKNAVAQTMSLGFTVPLRDGAVTVDWDHAAPTTLSLDALKSEPDAGATFAELPAAAASRASYAGWEKEFARWLLASKPLALLRHAASGLTSKPGESESEFRARIQLAGREKRDAAKEALQQKYAPKLAQITEQIRRAEQAQGRESDQATQRKLDTALSVGATIVGALFGRKKLSMSTIGRATTAAKSASRISKEDEDVSRAGETVESRKAQLATLDQQLQTELAAIDTSSDAQTAPLESITVQPKKSGIAVRKVALLWSSA